MENNKTCTKCKETKTYNDFHKDKNKKDGHGSNCKTCIREYRLKNKEKIKIYNESRKERDAELKKKWREKNKEKLRMQKKQWSAKNKDKIYSYRLKRRSKKHKVEFKEFERTQLLDRDNWRCQECNIKVHDRRTGDWNNEFKANIDHIVPISHGGDSKPENLRVLCRTCNLSKSDKTDIVIKEDGQIALFI